MGLGVKVNHPGIRKHRKSLSSHGPKGQRKEDFIGIQLEIQSQK